MTSSGLQLGSSGAVLAGEGEGSVAQVVNSEAWSTGGFACRSLAVHQVAGAHVVGPVAREEQASRPSSGVLEEVRLEHRQEGRGDVHGADTAGSLRSADDSTTSRTCALGFRDNVLVDLASHADAAADPVDVRAPELEQLALTKPDETGEDNQQLQAIRHRVDDGGEFTEGRRDGDPLYRRRTGTADLGRGSEDELLLLSGLEDCS